MVIYTGPLIDGDGGYEPTPTPTPTPTTTTTPTPTPTQTTTPTANRVAISTITDPATGDVYTLYSDGSRELVFKGTLGTEEEDTEATLVSTFEDPETGDIIATYSDGSTKTLRKGTKAQDMAFAMQQAAASRQQQGESAYALLFEQFSRFGLGSLIEPLKGFITQGLSAAELLIKLRDTEAYKQRFAANTQRIAKGLRAISEAEYIALEDSYQDIMRRYGLPESYYTRGDLGRQEGFEKFIANDVSAAELEDRIGTAYNRVINANPEVSQALREFYPDITNGDILAYTLDPTRALTEIKRKVTAGEIGGAALAQGLSTSAIRAEELGAYGVNAMQARQGYETIGGGLERGTQLASLYAENVSPYTQATAETEVFNLAGAAEAGRQRRKIAGLERATFGGASGATGGALARDRAGSF